jgi:hypothetical protein
MAMNGWLEGDSRRYHGGGNVDLGVVIVEDESWGQEEKKREEEKVNMRIGEGGRGGRETLISLRF